jgi:hypothetical protein
MIRKLKSGQYRLYSRKADPHTGRRRNLGNRAEAEKHERAVPVLQTSTLRRNSCVDAKGITIAPTRWVFTERSAVVPEHQAIAIVTGSSGFIGLWVGGTLDQYETVRPAQ